jgi:hypothetical protein
VQVANCLTVFVKWLQRPIVAFFLNHLRILVRATT